MHHGRATVVSPGAWDLDEADAVLIAYPDQLRTQGEAPLRTLARFVEEYLPGLVNTIHVLPFFPSSSDDGFRVVDHTSVDPAYGGWEELGLLGARFGLMYDVVLNHASVQGRWFKGFLQNDREFIDHFVEIWGEADLRSVVRPWTTPLLTEFAAQDGLRKVWTTFSADQADLNYRNPDVLLRILEIS